jgi:hypothetical protein
MKQRQLVKLLVSIIVVTAQTGQLLLIGSEILGENLMSFTVPRWPGSLYSNFLDSTSHMATLPSAPPAPILSPVGDQLARIRFFSIPDGVPS